MAHDFSVKAILCAARRAKIDRFPIPFSSAQGLKVIKVLIVDDSEMDRLLASHLLSDLYEFVFAGNGREALEVCDAEDPDLVVTDIVMPEMDGMEMLCAMQERYPEIPVIVMTSEGSEDIASQALELGAASYVPKSMLSERLKETVDQIVDMMRADRDYARLLDRMTFCNYRYELENDFTLIEHLVEFIQQIGFTHGICSEGNRHRLGIAIEEALFNAMYHGNLELPSDMMGEVRTRYRENLPIPSVEEKLADPKYAERTVTVDVSASASELRIVIEDQGNGFQLQRVRRWRSSQRRTSRYAFDRKHHGRGCTQRIRKPNHFDQVPGNLASDATL